jgi:hypothetical protein
VAVLGNLKKKYPKKKFPLLHDTIEKAKLQSTGTFLKKINAIALVWI